MTPNRQALLDCRNELNQANLRTYGLDDEIARLTNDNRELRRTIDMLRSSNDDAAAEIERLTKRLASVERISEIRGQCRDAAYELMAKDSVP